MELLEAIWLQGVLLVSGLLLGLIIMQVVKEHELRAVAESEAGMREIIIAGKKYWLVPDREYTGPRPRLSSGPPARLI